MEEELLSPVPLVLLEQERFPSSSPETAVALVSPPSPDDYCQFQDLLRRVAGELHIPLEEIQDTPHKLLDTLHSLVMSRVALPIDAIPKPARMVWHMPATCMPTTNRADKCYYVRAKRYEFFSHLPHPTRNSLVVQGVME